jgi:hypothetical protein
VTDERAHEQLIRDHFARTFAGGELTFAASVHGPGYRDHDVTVPGPTEDHASSMARDAAFVEAFPDLRATLAAISVYRFEHGRVVEEWKLFG